MASWQRRWAGRQSAKPSALTDPPPPYLPALSYNAIAESLEKEDYDDGSMGPVLLRLAWCIPFLLISLIALPSVVPRQPCEQPF